MHEGSLKSANQGIAGRLPYIPCLSNCEGSSKIGRSWNEAGLLHYSELQVDNWQWLLVDCVGTWKRREVDKAVFKQPGDMQKLIFVRNILLDLCLLHRSCALSPICLPPPEIIISAPPSAISLFNGSSMRRHQHEGVQNHCRRQENHVLDFVPSIVLDLHGLCQYFSPTLLLFLNPSLIRLPFMDVVLGVLGSSIA